ncbi:MAG: molybdopterin synthase sulfur carrier subunit [Thermoplasmata archaeon]|nr:molybdopterin synthase sulfur carrier subunit [Thermoplasmata archaeon]
MGNEQQDHAVKCDILFFGHLAEKFETKKLQIALYSGTTISQLAERLQIDDMLSTGIKVALNGEICDPDNIIPDAAEVAFLPPVSGG